MRNPLDDGAKSIDGLPIELRHVRTLEAFEGPLLVEFESDYGDTYLYNWCDREGDVSRWVVFKTTRQDLNQYLLGATTLRALVTKCRDGWVYLMDIDPADQVRGAYFVDVRQLPREYVPGELSYYDCAAAGAAPAVRADANHQDVNLAAEWSRHHIGEIGKYPRWYANAYTFAAHFAADVVRAAAGRIHYRLTTGYVFGALFDALFAAVPAERRLSVAGMQFASPGYIRFKVDPEIADQVRRAVAQYLDKRGLLQEQVRALRNWANEHPGAITEAQAKRVFNDICEILGISAQELRAGSRTLQIASKALVSFVNRIAFLANQDAQGDAMLVGLKRPERVPPAE